MIRLTHLSGSLSGESVFQDQELIQIGRASDCELRYANREDTRVSNHHAHIVLQQGAYWLVDTGSTNGTTVNGQRIIKHQLQTGDRIVFGYPGGPEVEVEIGNQPRQPRATSARVNTEFAPVDTKMLEALNAQQDAAQIANVLKANVRDSSAALLVEQAARKVAQERAVAGKDHSGHSMFIMAGAFNQVSTKVKEKTKKKWVKVVAWISVAAVIAIAVMGTIIILQRRQIAQWIDRKKAIDTEILAVSSRCRTRPTRAGSRRWTRSSPR